MILSLKEKCRLVGLFGDVSQRNRERLLSFAAFDQKADPIITAENYILLGVLDDGRYVYRKPSLFDT